MNRGFWIGLGSLLLFFLFLNLAPYYLLGRAESRIYLNVVAIYDPYGDRVTGNAVQTFLQAAKELAREILPFEIAASADSSYRVKVTVENDNSFALNAERLSYSVWAGENRLARGRLDSGFRLPGGGVAELVLPVDFLVTRDKLKHLLDDHRQLRLKGRVWLRRGNYEWAVPFTLRLDR